MDGLPEESKRLLPSLFAIRDGLYSLEFRRLVQSLTGSGPLSGEQIDLSANAFGHTGHLLCHDDVIGTRKVRIMPSVYSITAKFHGVPRTYLVQQYLVLLVEGVGVRVGVDDGVGGFYLT